MRAVFVDSANPLLTYADTEAYERAFQSLELLVVVDVAMTETARLAHYILPAASQFEKWEATGFNLEFPTNFFHLRHPLLKPLGESLSEPEIYPRLLEKMEVIPPRFPLLSLVAGLEPNLSAHLAYLGALAATLASHKAWIPYAASMIYRTLGPTLPDGAAAAAPLLPLAVQYASQHHAAVKRAGHEGNRLTLGSALFHAILAGRSGITLSRHEFADTWSLVKHPDDRIHLAISEMLDELRALPTESPPDTKDYPFVLMAGERRSYNANQIYRDPAWRKTDPDGALHVHPEDAARLGLANGGRARCESTRGSIEVRVALTEAIRPGVVTLPHGYGAEYPDASGARRAHGPVLNLLTDAAHRDPTTATPYHKHVRVRLLPVA